MNIKCNKILLAFILLNGMLMPTINAQSIAAGGWHSLVICNDSSVKAFGENATGQLGNGNTVDQSTPVTVPGLSGIIAVSAGGDQLEAHSMALKSSGLVLTWGSNVHGGLGNGTYNNSTSPAQVQGLQNVIRIAAGGWHSVALKQDGTVWCWGFNEDGQLGDGTVVNKLTPVQVLGLTDVVKIVAGTYHVLALKSDGTVWAWGDNISGQLGDGTTIDRTSPVQVVGLSQVKAIAAGRFFSLAIKEDGTVWTWGENLYGQLGLGNTTDKSLPTQIPSLSNVVSAAVATGAFHCLALKNDGTLWSWGRNTYGNLGHNTIVNSSTPIQVTGVTNVVALAAGTNFSLLQRTDGTFWACGRNASGQLGDGTTTQHNLFTQSSNMCAILQPVGVFEENKPQVNVYPNPSATGVFTIHRSEHDGIGGLYPINELEVYNGLGEMVAIQALNDNKAAGTITLNLQDQPSGIYYLRMRTEQGLIWTKLVK